MTIFITTQIKLCVAVRVSSRIFNWGGPASFASQILYLITTLGKFDQTLFWRSDPKGLVG